MSGGGNSVSGPGVSSATPYSTDQPDSAENGKGSHLGRDVELLGAVDSKLRKADTGDTSPKSSLKKRSVSMVESQNHLKSSDTVGQATSALSRPRSASTGSPVKPFETPSFRPLEADSGPEKLLEDKKTLSSEPDFDQNSIKWLGALDDQEAGLDSQTGHLSKTSLGGAEEESLSADSENNISAPEPEPAPAPFQRKGAATNAMLKPSQHEGEATVSVKGAGVAPSKSSASNGLPPLTEEQQVEKAKFKALFKGGLSFLSKHKDEAAMIFGAVSIAVGMGLAVVALPAGIMLFAVGWSVFMSGFANKLFAGGPLPTPGPGETPEKQEKKETDEHEGQFMKVDPSYSGKEKRALTDPYQTDPDTATGLSLDDKKEKEKEKEKHNAELSQQLRENLQAAVAASDSTQTTSTSAAEPVDFTKTSGFNDFTDLLSHFCALNGMECDTATADQLTQVMKSLEEAADKNGLKTPEQRAEVVTTLYKAILEHQDCKKETLLPMYHSLLNFAEHESLNEEGRRLLLSMAQITIDALKQVVAEASPSESPPAGPQDKPSVTTSMNSAISSDSIAPVTMPSVPVPFSPLVQAAAATPSLQLSGSDGDAGFPPSLTPVEQSKSAVPDGSRASTINETRSRSIYTVLERELSQTLFRMKASEGKYREVDLDQKERSIKELANKLLTQGKLASGAEFYSTILSRLQDDPVAREMVVDSISKSPWIKA